MPNTPEQQPAVQQPPAALQPSSTQPSGTPTKDSTPELASMVAPEFRYPTDESVPEYLRGKTAADAAQLLQGLVESVGRGQQAPPQQPVQAAADDDYVTGAQVPARHRCSSKSGMHVIDARGA